MFDSEFLFLCEQCDEWWPMDKVVLTVFSMDQDDAKLIEDTGKVLCPLCAKKGERNERSREATSIAEV